MAIASVETGPVRMAETSAINGDCYAQEELAVSGSAATLATAVTAAQVISGCRVVRVATDTACYVAVGTTPDATATAKTSATTARRYLAAGASIELPIAEGQKVQVKAA